MPTGFSQRKILGERREVSGSNSSDYSRGLVVIYSWIASLCPLGFLEKEHEFEPREVAFQVDFVKYS